VPDILFLRNANPSVKLALVLGRAHLGAARRKRNYPRNSKEESMKKLTPVLCAVLLAALTSSAYADLQNLTVGGQIRIRGRFWNNSFTGALFNPYSPSRVAGRAIGPDGIGSTYDWDNGDRAYVEQRTSVNVNAEFTDGVSAFIEIDSFDVWGEDFRSQDYLTGADMRANSSNDLEIGQAYIQVDNMWGNPVSLRVGRQALKFGKGWLISDAISPTIPQRYDGIRLTYAANDLSIDAFWMKIVENMSDFGQNDVDLYGVYAEYTGLECLSIAAYWFLVHDDIDPHQTGGITAAWEDLWNLNQFDDTSLHTLGIRLNGASGGFDYDLEAAYQFGDADAAGAMYAVAGIADDNADFDAFATDLEVGYTFDYACSPRIFLGGAYFEGDDNRDRDFLDYLNPFYTADASLSFNRLFSGSVYSATWDIMGGTGAASNFYQVRTGVSGKINENISTGLKAAYFWADEEFDQPANILSNLLPFWTDQADDELCGLAHIWLKYNYSADLWIKIGWEHIFIQDGMSGGNFLMRNATRHSGGTDDRDGDYVYFDMGLKF
jgi:hypothetical protein